MTITTEPWLKTLSRIIGNGNEGTTDILARMLYDIIAQVDDPAIDRILDAYGASLLGRT